MDGDMPYDQEADYISFKERLPELLLTHRGQFVVFHNAQLDRAFELRSDALQYARDTYGIGNYIVQEVRKITPRPASYSLLANRTAA